MYSKNVTAGRSEEGPITMGMIPFLWCCSTAPPKNAPVELPVSAEPPVEPPVETAAEKVAKLSHYGKGVLPGAFIKPEPGLTKKETQNYVKEELRRWLTGDICADATEIAYYEPPGSANVEEGKWPAGRLYMLHCLLTEKWDFIPGGSTLEEMRVVGNWATEVCLKHLTTPLYKRSAAMDLAIGFITKDLLPNGETVIALWNRSPFDALRQAPPLSETPDSPELIVTELPKLPESEEEEDEEEYDEEEYDEEECDEEECDEEIEERFVPAATMDNVLIASWVTVTSGVMFALVMEKLMRD